VPVEVAVGVSVAVDVGVGVRVGVRVGVPVGVRVKTGVVDARAMIVIWGIGVGVPLGATVGVTWGTTRLQPTRTNASNNRIVRDINAPTMCHSGLRVIQEALQSSHPLPHSVSWNEISGVRPTQGHHSSLQL
jgi:hypothetical protein